MRAVGRCTFFFRLNRPAMWVAERSQAGVFDGIALRAICGFLLVSSQRLGLGMLGLIKETGSAGMAERRLLPFGRLWLVWSRIRVFASLWSSSFFIVNVIRIIIIIFFLFCSVGAGGVVLVLDASLVILQGRHV